jgi:hypothetical protein
VAQESEEIYLLHRSGPANGKIRDGRLDIKRLQELDVSRLELWRPVFKAGFPLSKEEIRDAFAVLDLPCPRLAQASYSSAAFLHEIAGRALEHRAQKCARFCARTMLYAFDSGAFC